MPVNVKLSLQGSFLALSSLFPAHAPCLFYLSASRSSG
ncbi:hypothetical protein SD78_2531 [Bacillus badius]|nr:hypothetical protein SD78_2531 [Bacillus badius]